MNFLDGLSLGANLKYFIPPFLLLLLVPGTCAGIYTIIFKRVLPDSIYKYLLGPVALLGIYIWAVPMNTGFYEFFRSIL